MRRTNLCDARQDDRGALETPEVPPWLVSADVTLLPDDPHEAAAVSNKALIASVRKRTTTDKAVLGPCLASYEQWLDERGDAHPLFDLTRHLVETVQETERAIRLRMEAKHAAQGGSAADVEKSVTNSLRRSAGTNYQALVSYALARHLLEQGSAWYVEHPVPKGFGNSLAIRFTAGVPVTPEEEAAAVVPEGEEQPAADAAVTVKPDVDVLLRNAGWDAEDPRPEPVLLLSVKTSLADRAGAAARWKTYFDLVTRPCPNIGKDRDCAYERLGIELAHDPNVSISHGIVTANIYKINSDPYYTQWGELRSNQARANTFMFDLRYTTRNESEDVMAEGWSALTDLPSWLARVSDQQGLPL